MVAKVVKEFDSIRGVYYFEDILKRYNKNWNMISFIELIELVMDNNRINDARWKDWVSFEFIVEVYGEYSDEDITRDEAKQIIERAILSDGLSLSDDLRELENKIYGQNFVGGRWDINR